MAQRRNDRTYAARLQFLNLLYLLPGMACFGLVWTYAADPDVVFYITIFGFLSCILIGMFIDFIRHTSYKCPECGQKIAEPIRKNRREGDPIIFLCQACEIEWDICLTARDNEIPMVPKNSEMAMIDKEVA